MRLRNFSILIFLGLLLDLTCNQFVRIKGSDSNLQLIKLDDPAALCLDGSPGSLYISTDGDPKKIYLEFEGGGWCDGPHGVQEII